MNTARNSTTLALTALVLAAMLSTQASAQERRGDSQRPSREQILERFDTNKDGQLDQQEREAARKAYAQRGDRKKSKGDERGTPPKKRGERPMPAELLKRFDTNKDGKLDEAERIAARKTMGQRVDKQKSGDGERGTPPKRRGERPLMAEILKRFDTNKDGKLDEAERAEARKALARRQGREGGGDGPPPRRRRGEDGPPRGGKDKGCDR